MAKEEKIKDMSGNVISKIWFRAYTGAEFYALKYDDPNGLIDENKDPQAFPIYVGMSGQQPELLSTVLEELRRYREFEALKKKESDTRLENLTRRVDELETAPKKKWFNH